jgi:hypothetical protein
MSNNNYYPNNNQCQQQWDQGDYDTYNEQYNTNNEEYYYDESNETYDYYPNESQEYYPDQSLPYESQSFNQEPSSYEYENYEYQDPSLSDTHSLFYPVNPPLVVHNYGYDTQGDPISAIATTNTASTKLIYVASHTSSDSTHPTRKSGMHSHGISKSFRSSRMTVLYENEEIAEGEKRNIYSSFGAHPECDTELLDNLHSQLFGDGHLNTNPPAIGANRHKPRPTNSYGPPFGPPYLVSHSLSSLSVCNTQYTRVEEKHCMGISCILPKGDKICSISPYGVRVHTRGGRIVSDKEGMGGRTCGSFIGHDFVLVGGMPTSGNNGRNVHCMDLQRDLKVISSHTLNSDGGSSKTMLTVADMAMNRERNTVVVGCTDGTIRLLDGERRMVEVAKAKAQRGGVAKVTVYDVSLLISFCSL